MKFGELCPVVGKEGGFFITDMSDRSEMFFQNADNFYERAYARYTIERDVVWISERYN